MTGQPPDILHRLVDLDRYPIDDLNHGRGAAFLRDCQQHMQTHGWCNFDDFIRPDALGALTREANRLMPDAETLTIRRTIYQGDIDPSVPKGDPRRRELEHTARMLADDQIPADTLLQQLYASDRLTDFVRQVQGKDQLYRYADEFQALNIVALPPGGWHAWHYDVNECTVTLLLQAADRGGEFTFIPNSRDKDGERTEIVDAFLRGDMTHARTFPRGAGTLTLFRGGYSLHGVTAVEGDTPRITAILTYSETPNQVAPDEVNLRIYGDRVASILKGRN